MFERLKTVGKALKKEIKVYILVIKDERTPKLAKIVLGLALGYLLLPFDLIPDFIPVLGQLDDAVIVPALVILALKMIPEKIIEENRAKITNEESKTS